MKNFDQLKCVDFHTHPVTAGFRAAVSSLGIDPIAEDGFPLPDWSVQDQLAFMQEADIDFSVLSAPVPHLYNGDAVKAKEAARKVTTKSPASCRRIRIASPSSAVFLCRT